MTEIFEPISMTNFSFLRGASHPQEMVQAAHILGLKGIGIADYNTLAGVVRAHVAAREAGIKILIGARLVEPDGFTTVIYPRNRDAYGRLSRALTNGNRRSIKGGCNLDNDDLLLAMHGACAIFVPPNPLNKDFFAKAMLRSKAAANSSLYIAITRPYDGTDYERNLKIAAFAMRNNIKIIATNDAIMHTKERRDIADVVACIREKCVLKNAGFIRQMNAERVLKSRDEMARIFKDFPIALQNQKRLFDEINFSLDELKYEYPEIILPCEAGEGDQTKFGGGGASLQMCLKHQPHPPRVARSNFFEETVPRTVSISRKIPVNGEGLSALTQYLITLTEKEALHRYPDGVPPKIRALLEHEYQVIERMDYAKYFLTVYDIVKFARSQGVLCQGRGSAANSVVCFCLGITSVDPTKVDLLFERFISEERKEPPDIDVDFENIRREEVIQYIYEKYGRHHAGIAGVVVTYRARSALRETAKVMGFSLDLIDALSKSIHGMSRHNINPEIIKQMSGIDINSPEIKKCLEIARVLYGFPRHLSQHVGGFVITKSRLDEVVPIGNAAMPDRTFVEWDKDDLDALGILKIDVLALGMLTCVSKAFEILKDKYDVDLNLATTPAEDPRTYDMICRADTVGVFQIESRAQMSMLPRLKPREFYDLVIEVAIVRPGPIQGDMVHPYLRRRQGFEKVSFPSQELAEVLGKTLGVPLFQEQAMKIAIVAAGFSPSEADGLRRAMATFRKMGIISKYGEKLIEGMVKNGYDREFATRCFKQIEGFGEYGFPESHAASFALIVYVSAWLKCHYPDVFLAAILNSQPMGFYAAAQLIDDAKKHGVRVLPIDVNYSDWDNKLETMGSNGLYSVRLGFRQIKGFSEFDAAKICAARLSSPAKRGRGTTRSVVEGEIAEPHPPCFARSPLPALRGGIESPESLKSLAKLSEAAMERLAKADAFGSMELGRRDALWNAKGLKEGEMPLFENNSQYGIDDPAQLPQMAWSEEVLHDYKQLRLSLKGHPLQFYRLELEALNFRNSSQFCPAINGRFIAIAGLVILRQRPGTAKGVLFMTLEDEFGSMNIIVWPKVFEKYRKEALRGKFLAIYGTLQIGDGGVTHLIAERLKDLSPRLIELETNEKDNDAVKKPIKHKFFKSRDFQ